MRHCGRTGQSGTRGKGTRVETSLRGMCLIALAGRSYVMAGPMQGLVRRGKGQNGASLAITVMEWCRGFRDLTQLLPPSTLF